MYHIISYHGQSYHYIHDVTIFNQRIILLKNNDCVNINFIKVENK